MSVQSVVETILGQTRFEAHPIELIHRLAHTFGTTTRDLLPMSAAPDTLAVLQAQARSLLDALLQLADRDTFQIPVALLSRLGESPTRNR